MHSALTLLLGFLLGLVVMCDRSGTPVAGPERRDEPVAWRGGRIEGARPAEAEPHVEVGYQRLAPHAAGWGPRGWVLTVHEGAIPTPPQTTCGGQPCPPTVVGLTDLGAHAIHLTWVEGVERLRTVACWELSNAAFGGRDADFPWCADA